MRPSFTRTVELGSSSLQPLSQREIGGPIYGIGWDRRPAATPPAAIFIGIPCPTHLAQNRNEDVQQHKKLRATLRGAVFSRCLAKSVLAGRTAHANLSAVKNLPLLDLRRGVGRCVLLASGEKKNKKLDMLFLSGATSREVLLLARTVFTILHVLRTNFSRTDLIRFRAPFARLDVVLRKTRAASIVAPLFHGAAHRFRWLGISACAGPARVAAFLAERGLISGPAVRRRLHAIDARRL